MKKLFSVYLLFVLCGCGSLSTGMNNVLYENSAKINSKEKAEVQSLLRKAQEALKQKELEVAMQHYEAMRVVGIESPDTLNEYAVLLRQHWHLEAAARVYDDALALNKNYPLTHWNFAIYYELYRGNFNSALDHYRAYQRLALSPDPRVTGWIADLERRLAAQSREQEK